MAEAKVLNRVKSDIYKYSKNQKIDIICWNMNQKSSSVPNISELRPDGHVTRRKTKQQREEELRQKLEQEKKDKIVPRIEISESETSDTETEGAGTSKNNKNGESSKNFKEGESSDNKKSESSNNNKFSSEHISDSDGERESDKNRKNSEDSDNEKDPNMADQIELLTQLMAKMVDVQQQSSTRSVTNVCRNTIITFKKENVRNFLHSVEQAYKEYDGVEDLQLKVLEYAQSRVDTNVEISQKTYESFESFKKDMLNQFKPKEDILQLNQKILMLQQTHDETVEAFGNRTVILKDKYEDALYAHYELRGKKLDELRLSESEDLLTRHFVLGLKKYVRDFVRGEPENLSKAISAASTAEASAGLARTISTYHDQKPKNAKQNDAKTSNFKNRGGFHGAARGGFNKSYNNQKYSNNGRSNYEAQKPQQASNAGKAGPSGEQREQREPRKQGCWTCGDLNHKQAECKAKTRSFTASAEEGWRSGVSASKNSESGSSGETNLMTLRTTKRH